MRAAGLIIAFVLCCSNARAQTGQTFNRSGSGARAAGMANAFIAISDDGTAASWNPGGLGQLRKPEFSVVTTTSRLSFSAAGLRTRDDLAAFSAFHSSYSSTYLDFASLALPVTLAGKPVTFQGSWRRLYTMDLHQNVETLRVPFTPLGPPPVRFRENSDSAGGVNLISIAAAVKLTSRLSVGGGFNFWRGDWTEDDAASETPLDAPGPSSFRLASGVNRVRGHSVSLGLMLTYPRWSVGLVHQGPIRGDFSNFTTVTTSRNPGADLQPVDGKLRFPQALGLGAAWRPAPLWTVAFDLTWDDWTDTLLSVPGGPTVNLFDGLPPDLSAVQDTLGANAGAERLFHGEAFVVPLRFGVAWEPQGPRNAYTRDRVNYVMLAAGTGYNTNSLKFDVAAQYRWTSFLDGANFSTEDANDYLPRVIGERNIREWRVKVSVIVRIADTEKLHRTIRKIFGGA